MVGNNTPIFFVHDPLKFSDFIHTQKRDPRTNLKSPTAMWDFWSLSPESLHQVTILFSDRGTPASFRHMNGYGSHTYSFLSAENERVWIKFHFKTKQGIKEFHRPRSRRDCAPLTPTRRPATSSSRSKRARCRSGRFTSRSCPKETPRRPGTTRSTSPKFGRTRTTPLIEVGELELNRNPENYFAEIESAAYSPNAIVPGISFSPDKMLQARIQSYPDAHRYRLGSNYQYFPVNAPKCPVFNYQRDGVAAGMRPDRNGGRVPNYEPNSFGGPVQAEEFREPPLKLSCAIVDRFDASEGNDTYRQAGDLFRLQEPDAQRRLIDNVVGSMKTVPNEIQMRQLCHFFRAGYELWDGRGQGSRNRHQRDDEPASPARDGQHLTVF